MGVVGEMSERRYYWLRLKEDFFSSKRIKKLRKLAGGDTYTIIYLKMQLKSLKKEGVLEFTGIEDNFADELALDIDENPDDVRMTLAYLLNCRLIETSDEINFFLPYVKANTGSESAHTIRQRNYVQRKKLQQASLCDVNVTQMLRNGDVEKEIEKEIEKDKELDIDIEEKAISLDKLSDNNYYLGNYKREIGKKSGKNIMFSPPSLEEVTDYCNERNNDVDPQAFIDFYESKGWYVGKNKMKDWKAAVRTWEHKNEEKKPKQREYKIDPEAEAVVERLLGGDD